MDEPWPDDVLAVTCLRVETPSTVVPGSLVKTCWRCETAIWVSPATLQHVRDKPHRFLCMECTQVYTAQDKDAKMEPVTPEQFEELKATLEAKGLAVPTQEQLQELKKLLETEGLFPPGTEPNKQRWE